MGHLGVVLYEYLGEEYPEVLGSILGALKGIVNVIGMTKMTPPIKDLLPRLTPILKNRSVQCDNKYYHQINSSVPFHNVIWNAHCYKPDVKFDEGLLKQITRDSFDLTWCEFGGEITTCRNWVRNYARRYLQLLEVTIAKNEWSKKKKDLHTFIYPIFKNFGWCGCTVHLLCMLNWLCLCFFVDRHEKVQENCIDLVGRIADRGAEYVSAREWMRICFELLELLKAHKKAIRRATVNTFGYIAKAIGWVLFKLQTGYLTYM